MASDHGKDGGAAVAKAHAVDGMGDRTALMEPKPQKSFRRKYRKMRLEFDMKMYDCEELHRVEQKAIATAKRLAIQNE